MRVEIDVLVLRAAHYVMYGCACTKMQELHCSCLFIVDTVKIVKPLEHPSSLLGVYICASFGTGSFWIR